jgi:Protein of unknown function (DUF2637)
MTTTADHDLHAATATDPDALGQETAAVPNTEVDDSQITAALAPNAVQVTTVLAVSVVAAVAAVVSFMHMYELAARAGEGWRAWLVPLAIDGLVVAASMTMLVRRRAGQKGGWLAWVSLTLGIAASLAANIAAAEPTLIGRAVAAWPPIALLLAYELLMNQIHIASKRLGIQGRAHPIHPSMPTQALTMPSRESSAAQNLAAMQQTTASATATSKVRQEQNGTSTTADAPNISASAGAVDASTPSLVLTAVPDREEDSGEVVRQAARQRYLETLASGSPCTGRELADMFGMSERWGRYQIRSARRSLTIVDLEQDLQTASPSAHLVTPSVD